MFEEVTEIEFLGLVHTAEEWLTFARNLISEEQGAFAGMFLDALHKWAVENDNTQLQLDCRNLNSAIKIPQAFNFTYKKGGATDPHNRQKFIWKRNTDIDIFDFKLDEGRIIEALQKIKFKKLKGRRFWFVVHRVFKELKWLSVTMDNKFADWVGLYFQWPWDREKPWRTVNKEIRDADSWKWEKDSAYANLACLLWATFTNKPKRSDNEVPDDKEYFYLPNKKKINNGQF
jgi:hypothetical protein